MDCRLNGIRQGRGENGLETVREIKRPPTKQSVQESMKDKTLKKAAALRYDRSRDQAPKIVAKGRGKVAERIMALAREHDIPMVEDRNLAQMLEALDLNIEIPPELYQAVAEVLVFVYRMNQKNEAV